MITASVVLFHTSKEEIKQIIQSYRPGEGRQLFFVDNGKKPCAEAVKRRGAHIRYIRMNRNAGYGSAHNAALKEAAALGSRYHIVMNPDISFSPAVIDALAAYADAHPDVYSMMPKVCYPDGSVQYLCKLLPTPLDLFGRRFLSKSRWFQKRNEAYEMRESGYDHIMDPPSLSGCFMFLRMDAVVRHQLYFDEHFFMYCEDIDLSRRIHRVGKTVFYPEVQITHAHAQSSYHNLRMLWHHIVSAIRYFHKYGWLADRERSLMNRAAKKEIFFPEQDGEGTVSVCMASCNGEAFIREQIASVLSQIGPRDELVISDDGSTDCTCDIIRSFDDPRIRLHHANVHSPSLNFSNALSRAAGEYVFLADQDDVWEPDKVAVMKRYLKFADCVVSDAVVTDADGQILSPSFFALRSSGPGYLKNLYKNSYIGCCMAVRKRVLDAALPIPPQVPMHDSWLGLIAERTGKTAFIPEKLVRYRRHDGNASAAVGESTFSRAEQLAHRAALLGFTIIRTLKKR